MILLLKLLLSHFLGDFILQHDSWVRAKEQFKLKAWQFYVHILIHGALILLFTWDLKLWVPAVIITVSHGIVDALKLIFQKHNTKRLWFIADQTLHLAVIISIWYAWDDSTIELVYFNQPHFLILTLSVVLLTVPTSVSVKMLMSRWVAATTTPDSQSLINAGKYIGILERLFVFIFIVTNSWEGVGFLLAAKSIFRFGDLREGNDRKLTEYVLIGTLLSFGIAISVGTLIYYMLLNEDGQLNSILILNY